MKRFSLKEFIPTILFLGKFLGIYMVGNVLYGVYVTEYEPLPDPVTHWVTDHTAVILTSCGWPTGVADDPARPTTNLVFEEKNILAVYEGCNGINVAIIFVAFVVAFGPWSRAMLWFIPVGLVIIHIMNLARITLLFWVSVYLKHYMYFMHKYFFTAILYMVVFVLWIWWVKKFTSNKLATV